MGKMAFVFPGQGSQYVGMGKEMADSYRTAADVFLEAGERLGFSVSDLCWQGPEEELRKTYNTQPCLLTTSAACWKVVQEKGLVPDFVAGHSLGEYSALVAAGALSISEAVDLVRFRGQAMEAAVPAGQGTMAALLGMSNEQVFELCDSVKEVGVVEPANFNCPGQVVIAGSTPAVEQAVGQAKSFGAKKAVLLSVSGPFHSSLLTPAKEKMAERLGQAEFSDAKIPLVTNTSAKVITDKNEIIASLIDQVSGPVRWEESIRTMVDLGVDTFIEIGPGKVLSGLIKKIAKDAKIMNIEDPASLENTLALLKECG